MARRSTYGEANVDLREYAWNRGVFLWEVANEMKVCEGTLSRWLRIEFSANDRRHFKEAVDRVMKRKREEV